LATNGCSPYSRKQKKNVPRIIATTYLGGKGEVTYLFVEGGGWVYMQAGRSAYGKRKSRSPGAKPGLGGPGKKRSLYSEKRGGGNLQSGKVRVRHSKGGKGHLF